MSDIGTAVFQVIPLAAHPLWVTTLKAAFEEENTRWLDGSQASLDAFAREPDQTRAALRLITGQFWLGAVKGIPSGARIATCLRDPVERMLAHYMFVKTNPRHPLHEKLNQRLMGPVEYARSALSLDLDNGQVRALLDPHDMSLPAGSLDASHLEKAWARLQSLAAFGLAERFEESVALVQLALNAPDLSFILDSYDWIRPVSEAFSPSEIEGVRQSQALDVQLYRRAASLFEARVAQIPHLSEAIQRQRERGGALETSTRWRFEPKPAQPDQEPPRDVVWIASYPRSGNSWMRFLLDAYVFGPATDIREVSRLAVELDYWHNQAKSQNATDDQMILAVRDAQKYFDRKGQLPGQTFFKTHFQWSDRHPLARRTRAAIVLVRDPRDVLISGQNFSELEQRVNAVTPAQYARQFIDAGGDPRWIKWGYGTWEGFTLSWLGHGQFPVFLLRYEDLKANTEARLSQVLQFLGDTPDPERVRSAVANCRIDRLRDLERAGRVTPAATKANGKERWFFNRGLSGQSLRALADAEGDDLDARFEASFAAAMGRWGYCVPRATPEPSHEQRDADRQLAVT